MKSTGFCTRAPGLLVAAVLLSIPLPSQQPAPATAAPAGVARLMAYAGRWKIETESFQTENSKAGHDSHLLENDCWKSDSWAACRQIVDGKSQVLLVFTCPGDGDNCTSDPISADGSPAGSGKLVIEGNTWTFPWTSTEAGKTTWFRVVNVWSSPNAIEFRKEFSTDQVHWTRMTEGHEVKQVNP
jgi:hypothetical protein